LYANNKKQTKVKKIQLEKIFDSFNDLKILIIGDVMIDAYVWGQVDRISPEAPVPILSCNKRENRLGGAANVALNIKSLGATPILCSVIGKDQHARIFKDLLEKTVKETSGILQSKYRRTTVKTRFVSQNQHIIRVDEEDIHELEGKIEEQYISHIELLLEKNNIDAIIFEDYDKGSITKNIIETVSALANNKNIPILVDPKKRHFNTYKNVSLFKPNFKEFTEGNNTEIQKDDLTSLFNAAKSFQQKMNIDKMLITLSERGVFISDENIYKHIPAEVREISDVSGAGDTVISVATLCLACEMEMEDIAAISNLAGGIVCEIPVVVPIHKDTLLSESIKMYKKRNKLNKN